MALFEYPQSARLNRFLAKSKIFEFAKPNTRVKDLFTKQVEKIAVAYSLSNRSINLSTTTWAQEIQVFHIELKVEELNIDILECIDKAVTTPIIFELYYKDKVKMIACLKRPNESDSSKWVISDYVGTEWLSENTTRETLPVALDLSNLYEQILKSLMPREIISTETNHLNESLEQKIAKIEQMKVLQKEIDRLALNFNKEKQPNRQFEINKQLKIKKSELDNL